MYARHTVTPPQLNCNLDEWHEAEHVSFEGKPLTGCRRAATVYALWDYENLYLAFDVHSSKLTAKETKHDGDVAPDDGVEFLIDAHCDRTREFLPDDFSYHINILNVVYDDRGTPQGEADPAWHGVANHVVKIIDDYHYMVEAAIPWVEIGLKPQQGKTVIGIDFCVNGTDPETGVYDYFDWCGLKVFHDPSGFGELRLTGRDGAHSI
jgi:hypothetical protein